MNSVTIIHQQKRNIFTYQYVTYLPLLWRTEVIAAVLLSIQRILIILVIRILSTRVS